LAFLSDGNATASSATSPILAQCPCTPSIGRSRPRAASPCLASLESLSHPLPHRDVTSQPCPRTPRLPKQPSQAHGGEHSSPCFASVAACEPPPGLRILRAWIPLGTTMSAPPLALDHHAPSTQDLSNSSSHLSSPSCFWPSSLPIPFSLYRIVPSRAVRSLLCGLLFSFSFFHQLLFFTSRNSPVISSFTTYHLSLLRKPDSQSATSFPHQKSEKATKGNRNPGDLCPPSPT
jgi:hypothetical protein